MRRPRQAEAIQPPGPPRRGRVAPRSCSMPGRATRCARRVTMPRSDGSLQSPGSTPRSPWHSPSPCSRPSGLWLPGALRSAFRRWSSRGHSCILYQRCARIRWQCHAPSRGRCESRGAEARSCCREGFPGNNRRIASARGPPGLPPAASCRCRREWFSAAAGRSGRKS